MPQVSVAKRCLLLSDREQTITQYICGLQLVATALVSQTYLIKEKQAQL